ncbi:MAG: hypothetical protein A7316_05365 [Candidatus Altiarchaeales archaeon WOR_SM1_86-2]|nr:MAG: hypothetical protein A7316_05365 [Candidatus Altiarchaeales archaeon WOR_SM1_86-2]
MLDIIYGFIDKYFIQPGYNPVNTITYGVILGLAIFGVIKMLRKLEIEIDRNFILALVPFIIYGATSRAMVDANFYPEIYWLVAPGIYVTMFFITLGALLFSLFLREVRRINYAVPMLIIGSALSAYNVGLILLNFTSPDALLYFLFAFFGSIFLLFAAYCVILSFLKDHKEHELRGRVRRLAVHEYNHLIVFAHLFDASATSIGIEFFGYAEKHVLPRFLIDHFHTGFIMFPLKLLVVIPVIYLIDMYVKDDPMTRRFIKLAVLILGLSPGIRDISRMIMGV